VQVIRWLTGHVAWLVAGLVGAFFVAAGTALTADETGPRWLSLTVTIVGGVGTLWLLLAAWTGERRKLREYGRSEPDGAELVVLGAVPAALDDGRGAYFEALVQRAAEAVPPELSSLMSNVEIVVEDEPPPDRNLLGLYEGIPLTRRGQGYVAARPDKITIYRGPLERHYGYDPDVLESQVRRTVLHEIAHHFGISDERLVEIDRY
jgi:predicted Zn-dependent protease with MMP-like domain